LLWTGGGCAEQGSSGLGGRILQLLAETPNALRFCKMETESGQDAEKSLSFHCGANGLDKSTDFFFPRFLSASSSTLPPGRGRTRPTLPTPGCGTLGGAHRRRTAPSRCKPSPAPRGPRTSQGGGAQRSH